MVSSTACVSRGGDPSSGFWICYQCPETIPDPDLTDNIQPSCVSEITDHVNCRYEDDVVCICGGASSHGDMVWQCTTCPTPLPEDETIHGYNCEVTNLMCEYDNASCVCERISPYDREWDCDPI